MGRSKNTATQNTSKYAGVLVLSDIIHVAEVLERAILAGRRVGVLVIGVRAGGDLSHHLAVAANLPHQLRPPIVAHLPTRELPPCHPNLRLRSPFKFLVHVCLTSHQPERASVRFLNVTQTGR